MSAFDNLLPDAEGERREKIAARVGALQFLPVDEAPSEQDMQYRIISEDEMVANLTNPASAPLALGEDEEFRTSIGGAQQKTAYLRIDTVGQAARDRADLPYFQDALGQHSQP